MNIRKWSAMFIAAWVAVSLMAAPGYSQPQGKRGGKFLGKSDEALKKAEEKGGEAAEAAEENRERFKQKKNTPKGKALGHFKEKRGKGHFKGKKGKGDMDREQERVRERAEEGMGDMKQQHEQVRERAGESAGGMQKQMESAGDKKGGTALVQPKEAARQTFGKFGQKAPAENSQPAGSPLLNNKNDAPAAVQEKPIEPEKPTDEEKKSVSGFNLFKKKK